MKKITENRKTFLDRLIGLGKKELGMVEYAYDLAKEAHRTQSRNSGERYFEHPRSGCLILMDEIGIYESELIISFLLHDVGEDTPLFGSSRDSYDSFVKKAKFRLSILFGQKVANTVIALTKPSVENVRFFKKEEAYEYYIENLKKDEDAILLKMVDRLHNLRSLPANEKSWIEKQIRETEDIYMPIFTSMLGERKAKADLLVSKIKNQIQKLELEAVLI